MSSNDSPKTLLDDLREQMTPGTPEFTAERRREQSFRRGYTHGYLTALRDIASSTPEQMREHADVILNLEWRFWHRHGALPPDIGTKSFQRINRHDGGQGDSDAQV